ncbi:MAG: 3D domain-containing protein [Clostridium sp.]
MIKKTLLCITIVALCFNTSYISFATNLSPETQVIEESKVKFDELGTKITSLNSELSKLNSEIEDINSKLVSNNIEIEETDLQIKLINSQIEETKADIEKNQSILDGRIRSMYKSNMSTDMLLYVLTSDNFLDAVNRVYAVTKIVSLDKKMINEVKEKSEFLTKSSEELEIKQSSLKTLKESTLKDLASIEEKKIKQQESLDELNSEKANVASVIEANEEKLIGHPLSVINSGSANTKELQSAISSLKSLLPQLNSDYVINLANSAIVSGQEQIDDIAIEESKNTPPEPDITTPKPDTTPPKPDTGNGNNTEGSGSETYLATYTMEATAYTGGTITATGLKPVRDPNGISTIAVDPSVIPLGSKVLIPGYGYAIASDTGGAVKGNIIDLYLNSHEECIAWGRRSVTLHLIALPGSW